MFLFDEPLSNLDAGLRAQMRIEIGSLRRRLNTTTIYVTHDQVEAMTLGDRIVVLANGRIQQVGRPIELYGSPVNRFVAGFIGTPPMNFVDGRLDAEHGRLAFVANGVRVTPPAERVRAASHSEAITLGIRPEDLTVVSVDWMSTDTLGAGLSGRVLLVERLGGTSHLHVEVGPYCLMASVSTAQLPEIGDLVKLQVPSGRAHLFEGDGRSIL